uniref:Uncharacterized protein n=1 Tax=Oryza punctata TaxID=4537 RepID=A0A0E0KPF5_ORYPU
MYTTLYTYIKKGKNHHVYKVLCPYIQIFLYVHIKNRKKQKKEKNPEENHAHVPLPPRRFPAARATWLRRAGEVARGWPRIRIFNATAPATASSPESRSPLPASGTAKRLQKALGFPGLNLVHPALQAPHLWRLGFCDRCNASELMEYTNGRVRVWMCNRTSFGLVVLQSRLKRIVIFW